MKIPCPEHHGLIYVDQPVFNEKNRRINTVVECLVCDDEVIINGVYNFDAEGLAVPVKQ